MLLLSLSHLFAPIAALSLLATTDAAVYPAPSSCTGFCSTHDPALIRRSDGTYYRFITNGHIGVSTAPSISGPWTNRGAALPEGSSLTQGSDQWGPDISLVGSTYYMYYAVSSFGSQNSGIGVATSTTLDPGSWIDHGDIGLASSSSKPYNSIDPNLFQANGQYYLNFGSFWHDIYQVTMSSNLLKASGIPVNIAYNPFGSHAEEGSFVFSHGGYYYLFWSAGQCCGLDTSKPPAGQEYMIKVCRSRLPSSGFVDQASTPCVSGGGSIVLQSHDNIYAPGGQGVYNDPSLGPVMYYHYMDTNIGISDGDTRFGWNLLDFTSGWPVPIAGSSPVKPVTISTKAGSPVPTTSKASTITKTTPPSTTAIASGPPLNGQC